MNDVSQPTVYENERMWKTIDDVNATLDSLSLINRGQPTTSSLNAALNKIACNNLGYEYESGSETWNNAVIHEQEKSAISGYTHGRGTFIKELTRQRALADKDAALKAELDKVFPFGFSNEEIEKRWNREEKVEKDQFEDVELTEYEANIRFRPIEHFMRDEMEVRSCSPPFIAEQATNIKTFSQDSPSSQSGIHQESGIVVTKPISDNSLNNLEFTINNNDNEQRQSLLLTNNNVIVENVAAQLPVLRPKRCRNALLNSLDRRMALLGKEIKQPIKQSIMLKTPSDFLVPSSNSGSAHQGSYCYSVRPKSKRQPQNSDSDSFEYSEDDFPAL